MMRGGDFGVGNGLLTWARFYLEPTQEGGENVDPQFADRLLLQATTTASSTGGRDPRRGGSGRLGTLIVRRLEARGPCVRALTRSRRAAHLR